MPHFAYTAIDARGRRYQDAASAETVAALEASLQTQGAWLLKAASSERKSRGGAPARSGASAKRWDLVNFYTQLALLLEAGVTLSSALDKLAKDLGEAKLGPVARHLAASVEAGSPLPKAMARYPKIFSPQAIALVEAGEASGKLPECIRRIAANLEWIDGLVASARQALVYPLAVSAAALGLVALLFTVVVPRFDALFQQLSVPMPWITRAVLGASEVFLATWRVWAVAAIAAPLLLALPRRVPALGRLKDRVFLALPFFGEVSRSLALSHFCVALEMLTRSGIPLARSLELSARQSPNSLVAAGSRAAAQGVTEGRAMSEELARHPVFTQTFVTMAQTGERSGQLDTAMAQLGAYYNTIVPRRIKAFFSVFEPALILALTAAVGIVALALVLPILQLWNF